MLNQNNGVEIKSENIKLLSWIHIAVIGLTVYLAWLTLGVQWNSYWDGALTALKSPIYWRIAKHSLNELMQFSGGYAKDIWGILVYFSMMSLIFLAGKMWTQGMFHANPNNKDAKKTQRQGIISKSPIKIEQADSFSLPINWALGTATMSLVWFFLAWFGLIVHWVAYLLFTLGLVVGCINAQKFFNSFCLSFFSISRHELIEKIAIFSSVIILLICMLSAFHPEFWSDALVYHLGLPSYYIANKEFKPDPYNIFSYLNQNAEMLFLWSLLMKSEVALKLVNWTFLVMISMAMFTLTKKYSNRYCALISVLFLLMMPVVTFQSTVAGNDLQMAYYLLIGWILSISYIEKIMAADGNEDHKVLKRALFLSGCCFGAAFGTKHNALVVIFCCFLGAAFLIMRKQNIKKLIQCMFPWLVGIFIFASPWMFRSFLNTGNPIYPFYQKMFREPYIKEWHDAKNTLGTGERSKGTGALSNYKEYFREIIGTVGGTPAYQVGWIFGLFLLGGTTFFYKDKIIAQATCVISLISWHILSSMVLTPRYALTSMLFLCFPTAVSLENFSKTRILKVVIFFVVLSNVFFHGNIANLLNRGLNAFLITLAGASTEDYRFTSTDDKARIDELVAINTWMKKNKLGGGQKVLMVTFATPYRFESPFHYSSVLDVQYIDEVLDFCSTSLDVRNYLLKQGFWYILYFKGAWGSYAQSSYSKMTPGKTKVMNDFFGHHLSPLTDTDHLKLFKIN